MKLLNNIIIFLIRNNPLIPGFLKRRISMHTLIPESVISIKVAGGKTLKMAHNQWNDVTPALYWGLGYEDETAELFFKKCRSASVIIDIGANVGYYSLLAALSNPAAQIFSFEPNPILYERLNENVHLNSMDGRIELYQQAVSSLDGVIPLYVPKNGVLSESSTLRGFRNDVDAINCDGICLDNFAKNNQIRKIDLIKMDVEGAECMVLEGMKNILKDMSPDIICEVLPGRFNAQAEKLLKQYGYQFSWIKPGKLIPMESASGDPKYKFKNYFFQARSHVS